MEGLGFIHEKLDIKILILYILNHLPAAVDAQTLSDLVFCDNGIGYFDYSDCLAELVDTAHISEEDGKYRITEKGSRNVNEVASSLPYSVRMKADRVTEPIAEQMRRAAMIVARHTNTPEGGCSVHLALSDGSGRSSPCSSWQPMRRRRARWSITLRHTRRTSIRRSCVCSQKARKTKHEHLHSRGLQESARRL